MHTTVQHRRAANTLASTPFARPAGAKPSPASTAQHCTTTAPVIGTLALCAAQCPDSRVGRSGCSAKLLLMLPPGAPKATRSGSLSWRARTTGTRLRLTEGSITQVRPHLSGVSGVDAVDSTAFKLVRLSASSARHISSGHSIPAARTMSRPWIIMLKVAG